MTRSISVRRFRVGAAIFSHVLFPGNDHIELQDDATGETLLIYTRDCTIEGPDGRIGNFCMEGDVWVSYHGDLRTRYAYDFYGHEALLDAEVEFSKRYIAEFGPAGVEQNATPSPESA